MADIAFSFFRPFLRKFHTIDEFKFYRRITDRHFFDHLGKSMLIKVRQRRIGSQYFFNLPCAFQS